MSKALSKKTEARFKEIKSLTKNVNFCWNCGTSVPKIKKIIGEDGTIEEKDTYREVGFKHPKGSYEYFTATPSDIAGDYDVEISSKGISHFKGDDVDYWIVAEATSTFESAK